MTTSEYGIGSGALDELNDTNASYRMNDFRSEYDRRRAQFQHYLDMMVRRRREVDRDCFMIIQDLSHALEAALKQRRRLAKKKLVSVPDQYSKAASWQGELSEDHDQGKEVRFVQFSFWEGFVVCDLPVSTCTRQEGGMIVRDLHGFGYVGERPNYPYYRDDVSRWDPLQKQYLLNDMETAAGDTAHIFFRTWNFPVDARLYVTCQSFHTSHAWESDYPIE